MRDAGALAARYLVLFLVGATLLVANPWKLGDWSQYYSSATIHRLLAFHYDWARAPKTVVVLADDRYLSSGGGMPDDAATWPLPYAAWSSVLRLSRKAGAKAVFFDFTMADDRADTTFPSFVRTLEDVARDIPIFIVAGSPETGIDRVARAELLAAAARNPNISFVSAVSGVREPPSLPAYRLAPDTRGHPSAAVAIAHRLCGSACTARRGADIELVWAAPPSLRNCERRQGPASGYDGCEAVATGAASRAFQMLVLQPLRGPCKLFTRRRADTGCLPQGEAIISNVFAPEIPLAEFVSGADRQATYVAAAGAVVMVGLDFALARDRVVSPVYGSIPGVHAHAMALADLSVLGGANMLSPGDDDDRKALRDVTFYGATLSLAWLIQLVLRRLLDRRRVKRRHWTRGLAPALLLAVGGGEAALLTFGQPPSNWLGAIGTVSMVEWLIDRPAAAARTRLAARQYWRRAGVVSRSAWRRLRAKIRGPVGGVGV